VFTKEEQSDREIWKNIGTNRLLMTYYGV